jgi:hypothetical protein
VRGKNKRPSTWIGSLLVGAGTLTILAALFCIGRPIVEKRLTQLAIHSATRPPTTIPPTTTPEPLVPTRTPTREAAATGIPTPSVKPTKATSTPAPTVEPTETAKPTATNTPPPPTPSSTPTVTLPLAILWQGRARWGAGVATGSIGHYDVEPLRLGWYLNWQASSAPARPGGIEYAQMIRLKEGKLNPDAETVTTIARANSGSLWLVGNEPDVKWQDNVEPPTYARLYHEAYTAIKAADPTAQVAIGGVSQPTPLRLRYLDAVLTAYKEQFGEHMPVDVWNVHNFVLREESDSWGVDIPPGLSDEQGMLYEIDDNDDMAIFRQQIIDFRRWMVERGYQDYPLIVSEYGILMPEDYGFSPERVTAFLRGTFDFFLTATDPMLGYSEDDYRLVQRWCWYSLSDVDQHYPTGRLFDPSTGQMTAVGQGWMEYVNER